MFVYKNKDMFLGFDKFCLSLPQALILLHFFMLFHYGDDDDMILLNIAIY